jgi:hypothetical protein
MRVEHHGTDALGRAAYLGFANDLEELAALTVPSRPFVLFVGADASGRIPEPYYSTAKRLLELGAVYVLCWGPDCRRAEDLFDEAVVGNGSADRFGRVITTSHPAESIREALEFATTVAVPNDDIALNCSTLIVAFVGNVHWYNEGHACLEDLLHG